MPDSTMMPGWLKQRMINRRVLLSQWNSVTVCGLVLLTMLTVIAEVNAASAGSNRSQSTEIQKPTIYPQLGHSALPLDAKLSPDGRRVISLGGDGVLRVWDRQTSRELYLIMASDHLDGELESKKRLFVNRDGRQVAVRGVKGERDLLTIVSVASGEILREIWLDHDDMKGSKVKDLDVSPDFSTVAAAYENTPGLVLYSMSSGGIEQRFEGYELMEVAFIPDGRIASRTVGKIIIWNPKAGGAPQMLDTGRNKETFGNDARPGLALCDHWLLYHGENELVAFDWQTGKMAQKWKGLGLAFLSRPTGVCSRNTPDAYLAPYEPDLEVLKNSRPIRKDIVTGNQRSLIEIADVGIPAIYDQSVDGRFLVVTPVVPLDIENSESRDRFEFANKDLVIVDTVTGRVVQRLTGGIPAVERVFAFQSGGRALSTGKDHRINLWNLEHGRVEWSLEWKRPVQCVGALAGERRFAVLGSEEGKPNFAIFEMNTGKVESEWTFKGKWAMSACTVVPGRSEAVVVVREESESDESDRPWEIYQWNLQTGQLVLQYQINAGNYPHVDVSSDGKWTAWSQKGHGVTIFNGPGEGRVIAHGLVDKKGEREELRLVQFSADGQRLLVVGWSGQAEIWDIARQSLVAAFPAGAKVDGMGLVTDSPGGQVVSGCNVNCTGVELRHAVSGQVQGKLVGHVGKLASFAWIGGGTRALTGGEDGTLRLWNVESGQELMTMVRFLDGEWLSVTPEGYYASSSKGDIHLNVRLGDQVYGIDQFRSAFYRPQVVEETLRLGDREQALVQVFGGQRPETRVGYVGFVSPPVVTIAAPSDQAILTSTQMDLAIHVADATYPLRSVRVSMNGAQVWPSQTRDLVVTSKGVGGTGSAAPLVLPAGARDWTATIPLELEGALNVIEVRAFNGYSESVKSITVSLPPSALPLRDTILPNLWMLSIGINAYQERQIRGLSYAEADAQAIVHAFTRQKGKLFREVHSLVISDHSALKPTYDTILDNLTYLGQAGQNDVVVLFLAGHGLNDERGDFYFLPTDAVVNPDGSLKRSKAISWRELKTILDLPAKKLILADTCHSEGVSKKKTRGVDNDRFVKELQEMNAVVFTSSRGAELSQESDEWGHGAFTYALLNGLNGKADLVPDGKVSMKELDTYVSETVPQLTNGAQHPITDTPQGYSNFPVALVR